MLSKKREKMPEKIITRLSMPLKSLDAGIYKIIRRNKDDGTVDFYEIEFSFPESMGERGFLRTACFDELPDISEIKDCCLDEIKEFIEDKDDDFWADGYEEQAVKILKNVMRTKI